MPVSIVSSPPPLRKAQATASTKKPGEKPSDKRSAREQGVTEVGEVVSFVIALRGKLADAGAVSLHVPPIARELAGLGDRYEKLGEALDKLAEIGPFAGLLGAIVGLGTQLAVNHGKISPAVGAQFGAVTPSLLEAQMKMKVQEMEMEAMRQQHEAELNFRAKQREYAEVLAEHDDSDE